MKVNITVNNIVLAEYQMHIRFNVYENVWSAHIHFAKGCPGSQGSKTYTVSAEALNMFDALDRAIIRVKETIQNNEKQANA